MANNIDGLTFCSVSEWLWVMANPATLKSGRPVSGHEPPPGSTISNEGRPEKLPSIIPTKGTSFLEKEFILTDWRLQGTEFCLPLANISSAPLPTLAKSAVPTSQVCWDKEWRKKNLPADSARTCLKKTFIFNSFSQPLHVTWHCT